MQGKYQLLFEKNRLSIVMEGANPEHDEKDSWNQKSQQAGLSGGKHCSDYAASVKSIPELQKSINSSQKMDDRSHKMKLDGKDRLDIVKSLFHLPKRHESMHMGTKKDETKSGYQAPDIMDANMNMDA